MFIIIFYNILNIYHVLGLFLFGGGGMGMWGFVAVFCDVLFSCCWGGGGEGGIWGFFGWFLGAIIFLFFWGVRFFFCLVFCPCFRLNCM